MWWKAIILGIIQGIAEFLPISSSGHLVLASEIFQISAPGNVMEVMLHLGTLGSVVVCFWSKIKYLMVDFFLTFNKKSKAEHSVREYKNLSWYLVLASIPAVVTALLLDSFFQLVFDKVIYTGIALLITATILMLADKYSNKNRLLNDMKAKDAVSIGLWQSIAVLPGISRAGMTVFGGLKQGFSKKSAVEWSFLMSIPIIGGATLIKIPALFKSSGIDVSSIIIGTITSFIAGIFAIKFLLSFIEKHGWKTFSIYCYIIGVAIIITTLI